MQQTCYFELQCFDLGFFVAVGNFDLNGTARPINLQKPKRSCVSASSLLKEAQPKDPTEELKEKLGLIECNEFNSSKNSTKNGDVFPGPQRIPSVVNEDEDENCRPSLSPYMKVQTTPLINKKSMKFSGNTPNGFMFNLQSSGVKENKTNLKDTVCYDDRSSPQHKDLIDGKVIKQDSLALIDNTKKEIKKSLFLMDSAVDQKVNNNDNKENFQCDDPTNKDQANAQNQLNRLDVLPKKYDAMYKTPLKELNRKFHPPKTSALRRKPLTEIKSTPKNLPLSNQLHRYDKPCKIDSKENDIQCATTVHSGLTDIINSVNLLKDPQSTTKTFCKTNKPRNPAESLSVDSNRSSCSRGLFKGPQLEAANAFSTLHKSKPSDEPLDNSIVKIEPSTKPVSENKISPEAMNKSENKLLSLQQQDSTICKNTTSETLITLQQRLHDNSSLNGLINLNKTPASDEILHLPNTKVSTVTEPTPQQSSNLIESKNTRKSPNQGTHSVDDKNALESNNIFTQHKQQTKPSTDVDIKKIVESGLKTLAMNGFNVDSDLQPIPQQCSASFFINNKQYGKIKCIGKGGSGKVNNTHRKFCFVELFFSISLTHYTYFHVVFQRVGIRCC